MLPDKQAEQVQDAPEFDCACPDCDMRGGLWFTPSIGVRQWVQCSTCGGTGVVLAPAPQEPRTHLGPFLKGEG